MADQGGPAGAREGQASLLETSCSKWCGIDRGGGGIDALKFGGEREVQLLGRKAGEGGLGTCRPVGVVVL